MTAPIGKRFTHVYVERGAAVQDSRRLRNRLVQLSQDLFTNDLDVIRSMLQRELGLEISHEHPMTANRKFFVNGALHDVLDAITKIYVYAANRHSMNASVWHREVTRFFQEENVGYRLDERCGVHFLVDAEFDANRAAALVVLGTEDLRGALAAFEDTFRHLDASPPDTKAGVRSIFEAVEIVSRLIVPGARNLSSGLVTKELKPACLDGAAIDPTERRVSELMFASLADWVDGLHFYRHGQGSTEPVAPSWDLTIYSVSTGAAHLRFLASQYTRIKSNDRLGPGAALEKSQS